MLGIDEVGRGPWAGPLVVGAVVLGLDFDPEIRDQLTDSKKLSAKKRQELNTTILEQAAATGLGWVSAKEVDCHGLGPALKLAARRAVKQVLATCKETNLKFDEIVIDGTINLLNDTPLADKVALLKKADLLVKEVSAASIIAKVARDQYMIELSEKYPGYGFENHVGYGTAAHQAALRKLGPCVEHRRSFRPIQTILQERGLHANEISIETQTANVTAHLKSPDSNTKTCTTAIGQTAEEVVADYLRTHEHQIIAQNCKTKTYEIDLISAFEQTVFFTEVKYRKNSHHGGALASITPQKQARMRYAATAFLASHPEYKKYKIKLAAAAVTGPDFTLQDWFELTE